MVKVRSTAGLNGLFNGKPWPAPGTVFEVGEETAKSMARIGLLELVETPEDKAPDTETPEATEGQETPEAKAPARTTRRTRKSS